MKFNIQGHEYTAALIAIYDVHSGVRRNIFMTNLTSHTDEGRKLREITS